MNIGIYGGSFDPPHMGHLYAIQYAFSYYDLDEIVIVPCYKQTGKNLSDFDHRYNMCRLMFKDLSDVWVSRVEEIMGGESITTRMVETFKYSRMFHDRKIYLIVGTDVKEAIPNWEGGKELMNLVDEFIVVPKTEVSSTEIRNLAKMNVESSKTLKSISNYIFDNKLYV